MGLARSAAKPEKSAISRLSLLAEPRRSLCHTAVSFSKASLKKGSCVSRETVATTSTGSAMEWGVTLAGTEGDVPYVGLLYPSSTHLVTKDSAATVLNGPRAKWKSRQGLQRKKTFYEGTHQIYKGNMVHYENKSEYQD